MNLKVGDKVRVIAKNMSYAWYEEWADLHIPRDIRNLWVYNGVWPEQGQVGEVVAVAEHLKYSDRTLAAIKSGNNVWIFGVEGLETIVDAGANRKKELLQQMKELFAELEWLENEGEK